MEPMISMEDGDGDDYQVDDSSSGNNSDAPADLMSCTGLLPSKSSAATTVRDDGNGDGDDEEYDTGANATDLMIASDGDDDDDGGDDGGAASSSSAAASGAHSNGTVTRIRTTTADTVSIPRSTAISCGAPSLNEAADAADIAGVSGRDSSDAIPDGSGGGGGGVRVIVLDSAALSSSAAALLEQMGDDPLMGTADGFGSWKTITTAAAATAVAAGAREDNDAEEDNAEEEDDVDEGQQTTGSASPSLTTSEPLHPDGGGGGGGGRSGQLNPGQAAADCARAMTLIAAAADRLAVGPQAQATALAPSDGGTATATGATAPMAVAGGEMDTDLVEACRVVRELSRAGQVAALQDPGAGCVAALMRIGAASTATDLDRAAAFAMVSELMGPREPYKAPRALVEVVAADTAGLRALVHCLSRWGTHASAPGAAAAATPLAVAALRAVVSLSSAATTLAALLRVRLLAALAAVLARGVSAARVQVSAAAFLAGLSSYSALGKLMLAAGIHVLASRLVGIRSRPLAVRESCCDIIANLSLGPAGRGTAGAAAADREAQAALTSAGAGPGLTKMLSLRNVQALCRTSDAISNLSLGAYVPAQNALRGAIAPLAGLLVGSVGQAGQPLLLAVKAARALGNACQNHPPNQDTAIKANVMPVLVAWMQSRVGPLVRAAAAAAANLVVGNSNATDAAVASGILSPVLVLLMQ
ncbi:hypothetical protein Vafri_6547, partial [Volvox africanus]